MTQTKRFLQALISLGLLSGLIIGLIWLFGTFNRPQTASQLPQTAVPTAAVTMVSTPDPAEVQPTLISPIATPSPISYSAGILFENMGELYWQPVDAKAQPLASASHIPIEKSSNEKISIYSLSPDGKKVLLGKTNPSTESEVLLVLNPPDGELRSLFGGISLGLGTKVFGWYPDSKQIVYWEGGPIKLLDVASDKQTTVFDPQQAATLFIPTTGRWRGIFARRPIADNFLHAHGSGMGSVDCQNGWFFR